MPLRGDGQSLNRATAALFHSPRADDVSSAGTITIASCPSCNSSGLSLILRLLRIPSSSRGLRLFSVDEVHSVGTDVRGAVLEVVVSRMKTLGTSTRFVAVSATVPNIKDVAQWLSELVFLVGS